MKCKFNYGNLVNKINEVFGSRKEFAKVIELSETSLSKKLNSKSNFTSDEIVEWCKLLDIKREDIDFYFFDLKVKQV